MDLPQLYGVDTTTLQIITLVSQSPDRLIILLKTTKTAISYFAHQCSGELTAGSIVLTESQ